MKLGFSRKSLMLASAGLGTAFGVAAALVGGRIVKPDNTAPDTSFVGPPAPPAPAPARKAFNTTNVLATAKTQKAFPIAAAQLGPWMAGAVETVYLGSPEDVLDFVKDDAATHDKLLQAIELKKSYDAGEINEENFKKFLQKNDIWPLMTKATRSFLEAKYNKAFLALNNPDDHENDYIPGIAQALLLGQPTSQKFRTNAVKSGLEDSLFITTSYRQATNEMIAHYVSGLPLALLKNRVPVFGNELPEFGLGHEAAGHGLYNDGENNADVRGNRFYQAGWKAKLFKTKNLDSYFMSLRAIGAFLGSSDKEHGTSAMIRLTKKDPAPVDASLNQYMIALKTATDIIALDIAQNSNTTDHAQIALAALNAALKAGKPLDTPDHNGTVLEIADHWNNHADDPDFDVRALYKKLPVETREFIAKTEQDAMTEYGRSILGKDLPLLYQTMQRLDWDGAFSDNEIGQRYVDKFLKAAAGTFSWIFIPGQSHALHVTPSP